MLIYTYLALERPEKPEKYLYTDCVRVLPGKSFGNFRVCVFNSTGLLQKWISMLINSSWLTFKSLGASQVPWGLKEVIIFERAIEIS